jgi:protein TonB
MERREKAKLTLIVGGSVVLLLVLGIFYGLWKMFSGAPPVQQKTIRQVTLVKPPPPPPPPPEVEEPEPEIEEEMEEPEPEPDPVAEQEPESDAPPADDLGLDADGVAGSDAFGLAARKGGRGLLEGQGSRFQWFANLATRVVEDALLARDEVRKKEYNVVVQVWIGPRGQLTRYELEGSTGDRKLDEAITLALAEAGSVSEPVPPGMPQPIRMRIRSDL